MSQTYGTPGQPTYSTTLGGIDEMLNNIPDNSNNFINAKAVRDIVFTLYSSIQSLSQSVSQVVASVSASNVIYNNTDPSIIAVGGIGSGTSFPNKNLQELFDDMFYPYVRPNRNISISTTTFEFGNTGSVVVNFTYSKTKNDIQGYLIQGGLNSITGLSFSSSTVSSGFMVRPLVNQQTIFTLSVADFNSSNGTGHTISSPNVSTATATLVFRNRRYFGTFTSPTLVSLGNPDISGIINTVVPLINSSVILTLNSEFATNFTQTRGNFGAGGYHIFAWPSSFGSSPIFNVNGLLNNAYTRVLSSWTFSNSFGFETLYDVWMSNTFNLSPVSLNIS